MQRFRERIPASRPRARLRLEVLEDRTLLSCSLSLTPSLASPQLVGEPITWTATPTDCASNEVYQFRVGPAGLPSQMMRDFSPANTFRWTPMQEGNYEVTVVAEAGFRPGDTTSVTVADEVDALATGSAAVITPTANPLVALYSVPPAQADSLHVEFAIDRPGATWRSTNEVACVPGESTNVLVAGMLPNTTYQMRTVLSNGRTSQPQLFTTGPLSSMLQFPSFEVAQYPDRETDIQDNLVFHMLIPRQASLANPTATDLQGRIRWYYDTRQSGLLFVYPVTLEPGGTVFLMGSDRYSPDPMNVYNVLREIDLAGNVLRETDMAAVNAQLFHMGMEPIYGFHHDAKRLPDGSTAILALTQRTVTINGQDEVYVGDDILVLNRDFQVTWVWDAFHDLDVNRGPILGERDIHGNVDWLHSNSLSWSPADGNLILSIRNQDWAVKIDYENGAGDGRVIWRLGPDGDFTVAGTDDPAPWFTHQHDVKYINDHTLVLFDNGNTRIAENGGGASRGQEWQLDEQTLTATLRVNADLGAFSQAVGAAQALPNGNFSFDAGLLGSAMSLYGQSMEVLPDGTFTYVLQQDTTGEYRSFRMRTLYDGTNGPFDAGTGTPATGNHGSEGVTGLAPSAGPVAPDALPGWPTGGLLAPLRGAAAGPTFEGGTARKPLGVPLAASDSRMNGPVDDSVFPDLGSSDLTDPLREDLWN